MARQSDPETERKRAWLNRYQDSLRRQRLLLFQVEDARSYATSIQAAPGGARTAYTGTYSDRVANAVQRIDELQRKYIAEVERGYQVYDEIQAAINALPDTMQAMALYYRYLQGMKGDLICVKLDRSRATVTKLLSTGLAALEVPENSPENPKVC